MDVNELLSYKPSRSAGEKRPLESIREDLAPPCKTARVQVSNETKVQPAAAAVDGQYHPPAATHESSLDLNGVEYEEKLRLLQSLEDEEEDAGVSMCKGTRINGREQRRMVLARKLPSEPVFSRTNQAHNTGWGWPYG